MTRNIGLATLFTLGLAVCAGCDESEPFDEFSLEDSAQSHAAASALSAEVDPQAAVCVDTYYGLILDDGGNNVEASLHLGYSTVVVPELGWDIFILRPDAMFDDSWHLTGQDGYDESPNLLQPGDGDAVFRVSLSLAAAPASLWQLQREGGSRRTFHQIQPACLTRGKTFTVANGNEGELTLVFGNTTLGTVTAHAAVVGAFPPQWGEVLPSPRRSKRVTSPVPHSTRFV